MSLLNDFRISVMEQNLGVYGVHVYQRGKELEFHKFRADDRINIFSGSKTFTSMAVGIARSEGLLSLDDKVIGFFPECRDIAYPGSEEITIKHILNMCSGHLSVGFTTDETTQNTDTDWVEIFFKEKLRGISGKDFFYENMCTYILGRVIETVSGVSLKDYLKPRLFAPLGIPNPQWFTCPKGHTLAAAGLHLKTEEFSRLGILMLNGGVYNDKELVSHEYINEAVSNCVDSKSWSDPEGRYGYGYQLWRCSVADAFRADGKYGQFSIVLPNLEAIVTITAHNERNANDILRAVWKDIIPKL